MKTRNDFVTNSSSSSFLLAFQDQEDGAKQIASATKYFGSVYISRLLTDFMGEIPIPPDKLKDEIERDLDSEASFFLCFGNDGWWSDNKDTFEKQWHESHPGASHIDFYRSEEYQAARDAKVKAYMDDIVEKIDGRPYLVMLEYEDHDEVGSALEHDILPNCDFTVRRFSHH